MKFIFYLSASIQIYNKCMLHKYIAKMLHNFFPLEKTHKTKPKIFGDSLKNSKI